MLVSSHLSLVPSYHPPFPTWRFGYMTFRCILTFAQAHPVLWLLDPWLMLVRHLVSLLVFPVYPLECLPVSQVVCRQECLLGELIRFSSRDKSQYIVIPHLFSIMCYITDRK